MLTQSPAIFRDIQASCVRRHEDAAPIAATFLPAKITVDPEPASENPVCAPFEREAGGLIKASEILGAYFRAMQQLAAFNTSAVSSESEKAGQNAGYEAKFNTAQADSVGKLASLVTELVTGQHQRKKLLHLLREADPSVASVTQALEDVVSKDYEDLLKEEQQSLTAQYQNVADTGNQAVILLLNRSYADESDQLARRRAAAETYVQALQKIREGHHQLALNLNHLKAKELSMALQPYTASLQELLSALSKGL